MCNTITKYFKDNCGSDIFQAGSCLMFLGGVGGFAIGYFDHNTPLEIISASLSLSNAVLGGRIGCLRPLSDLGRNARALGSTAEALKLAENQTKEELKKLQDELIDFQKKLEKTMTEKEELEKIRAQNLNKIQELTARLEKEAERCDQTKGSVQTALFHISEETAKAAAQSRQHAEQINALNSIETGLEKASHEVAKDISALHQENRLMQEENTRLQQLISQFKEQIQQLEKAMKDKELEQEALRALVQQFESAKEVADRINRENARLESLLRRVQQAFTATQNEPFPASTPPHQGPPTNPMT